MHLNTSEHEKEQNWTKMVKEINAITTSSMIDRKEKLTFPLNQFRTTELTVQV